MKEYIFEIDGALVNEETGECVMHPSFKGELIRCKDCKKNGTSDCAMGRWIYSDNIVFLKEHWNKPQDYCSWAERKEE